MKTFRYRLCPNDKQEQLMKQFAGASRFIYNWGLARWTERYAQGLKTTVFDLNKELTVLKYQEATCWLQDIQAQSLQQALGDLGAAFSNFFSKKSGYPQFHKKGNKDSFRLPQRFHIKESNNTIRLPSIGLMKYRFDRLIQGMPRHVTVTRQGNHWYACVTCIIKDHEHVNTHTTTTGIDVGVAKLATVFDGTFYEHHLHHPSLDKLIAHVKVLQQQHSHKQKRSKNREKARCRLAQAHAHLTNARNDTLHKLSTKLAKTNAVVVIEALKIKNMTKSASGTLEEPGTNVAQKRGLNRVIVKQAWGKLFGQLEYKCRWYGSLLVKVNPAFTSQTCPSCGHVHKDNRKNQATFLCTACNYTNNADVVGAMNIRLKALQA